MGQFEINAYLHSNLPVLYLNYENKKKAPSDLNQLAKHIVDVTTQEPLDDKSKKIIKTKKLIPQKHS